MGVFFWLDGMTLSVSGLTCGSIGIDDYCDGDRVCSLAFVAEGGEWIGSQSGKLRTSSGVGWLGSIKSGVMEAVVTRSALSMGWWWLRVLDLERTNISAADGDDALRQWRNSVCRSRAGGLGALSTFLGDWNWACCLLLVSLIGRKAHIL
ncbi:hypothetical protein RchiOBHm_Chr7g0242461 [Rosa chinensis]|uniref:Non-specific serine/threonine protein kinase n=1 Tax=Rosa chinensis TaxID=74649 RepID=A0A2P6PII9_ROSCH|nr:hypothetical protein RchiOBHm_Chr7g0242461 [Rosa chinensis]